MNSPNPSFRLRFPERDIPKWAARFPNTGSDDSLLSRAALATSDEALKINLLRLLDGVDCPTASTILHFCDARPYPILDYTRGLAARLGLPIRTVDKALWQYSKEKQP